MKWVLILHMEDLTSEGEKMRQRPKVQFDSVFTD